MSSTDARGEPWAKGPTTDELKAQIESLQRENEELNGRLLDLQLDYVEALTNAITPEMRERIKAYKDWLDSPNTGELSPEHIYNILSDLLGEQDA